MEIEDIKSYEDTVRYINYLYKEFTNLNKAGQNVYINDLQKEIQEYKNYYEEENKVKNKDYVIFNNKKSFKFLVINELLKIENSDNFIHVYTDIMTYLNKFNNENKTSVIKAKEIKDIFNLLYDKYPELKELLHGKLIISVFNNGFSNNNIITNYDVENDIYHINCFYLVNDEDNPCEVLLNELCNIIKDDFKIDIDKIYS